MLLLFSRAKSGAGCIKAVSRALLFWFLAATPVMAQVVIDESYLEADLQEVWRLDAEGNIGGIGRLMADLPEERAIPLARNLMDHETTIVAYMACGILIRAGLQDETLPALAEILASGRAETDLKGRMGYDWLHGDEDDEAMFGKLAAYLEAHLGDYEGEELARVTRYVEGMRRYR